MIHFGYARGPNTNLRGPMRPVLRNAVWGVKHGAIMAALYSIVMLGIYAVVGAHAFHTPGLTLAKVLSSYWVAGFMAGLTIGLLRPLLQYRWGVGLVGGIAGIAVVAAFQASDKGPAWGWTPGEWLTPLILGTFMGVVAAYDPRVGG